MSSSQLRSTPHVGGALDPWSGSKRLVAGQFPECIEHAGQGACQSMPGASAQLSCNPRHVQHWHRQQAVRPHLQWIPSPSRQCTTYFADC